MSFIDTSGAVVEARLRAIVRNNFEHACQSSMKRAREIQDRMRTSSVWITQAKSAVIDELKAAVFNCVSEAERDIPISLRDPPQALWDQIRLYMRETLFRSLNSIQHSVRQNGGSSFPGSFEREFRDINFPIEHAIDNAVGEKIQQDQLRLLAKPSLEASSKPQQGTATNEHTSRFEYVDQKRIDELRKLRGFDPQRLIQLCEELNASFKVGGLFGPAMLVRAILDHVPPIFGLKTFSEVSSQYSAGTRSFKESMARLDSSLRKIADSYLHTHIRQKESLPTVTQINFSNDLDVLLAEIIRKGCP